MKKLLRYVPFHFVLCLIVGICFQFYFNIWHFGFAKMTYILGVCLLFLFFLKQKIFRTIIACISFVFIGIYSTFLENDKNFDAYYQSKITPSSYAVLIIKKELKQNQYAYKFEAEVSQIDAIITQGKILINLQKDTLASRLTVNDVIYVKADFLEVKSALNPHQFNYKSYLASQGIHQQLYINRNDFEIIGQANFSLIGLAAKVRKVIQESLEKQPFSKNTLSVINALLLGQRQDISKELVNDYSKAGAIHILAVSGLHVGVILIILNLLLRPILFFPNGKILKFVIILLLLWSFSFIAGLSASVVRAVTMFSFVAFGETLKRKKVTEFSLMASMFLLLVCKPTFLFEVGFQMSYLAVFGIIWVQPKLIDLWNPKNIVVNYFWQIMAVSMAAQLGVLPLSLFYFHQFPGLFFLSNVIIIPFLGAILIGGIFVILLAVLDLLPSFLAKFYNTIIELLNAIIHWVSSQESFLFTNISMSFLKMIGFYLLIIALFQVRVKFSYRKLLKLLFVVLVFQGIGLFEKHKLETKNEFVIFNKSRKSIFLKRVGDVLKVDSFKDSINFKEEYNIVNYKVGERISNIEKHHFNNYFKLNNQAFLVVDALGIYNVEGLHTPIVILKNSPKINLERLIKTIQPKQIIADGNNYKSFVKRWNYLATKNGVSFFETSEKGAFIYKF